MASNNKINHSPSSFTNYLKDDNFTSKLEIPSDFMRKEAENLSQQVLLKTNSGVQHQIVKVEKIRNRHFCTHGWGVIAQALHLQNGELLLFKLVEDSKFQVSVYGTNRCIKEISWDTKINAADSDQDDDDYERDVPRAAKSWTLVLTQDHANQVEIPKEVLRETGILMGRRILDLVSDGKTRKVSVTPRKRKVYMTTWWNQFLVEDKVQVGSTILFDFEEVSSNVVKFKMLKPETEGGLFPHIGRGRGRPPKFISKA